MSEIKLTQYSHGAGCGCKISPALLDTILKSSTKQTHFPSLLVGNQSSDDAAVFDLGDGNCIVSTTDFFMPIVDDPFTFGAIASVNAISDVYAMGGKPVMAIAILGWPINTLSAEVAQQVLEGSRSICEKAGIPLAGGHSIDSPEPIFGLAVTGSVRKENLKRNDTAKSGAHIYLTKPLGIGIITTAQKKGIVEQNDFDKAVNTMLTLNSIGAELGAMESVCALTDVTGFGLLGHLTEVCRGSGLSATIEFSNVPKFDFLDKYVAQKSMPGGTQRNWDSYGKNISSITDEQKAILADPQTSGGLLICVEENGVVEFENWAGEKGLTLQSFGKLTTEGKYRVVVNS